MYSHILLCKEWHFGNSLPVKENFFVFQQNRIEVRRIDNLMGSSALVRYMPLQNIGDSNLCLIDMDHILSTLNRSYKWPPYIFETVKRVKIALTKFLF